MAETNKPKYTEEQKAAAIEALSIARKLNEIMKRVTERNAAKHPSSFNESTIVQR